MTRLLGRYVPLLRSSAKICCWLLAGDSQRWLRFTGGLKRSLCRGGPRAGDTARKKLVFLGPTRPYWQTRSRCAMIRPLRMCLASHSTYSRAIRRLTVGLLGDRRRSSRYPSSQRGSSDALRPAPSDSRPGEPSMGREKSHMKQQQQGTSMKPHIRGARRYVRSCGTKYFRSSPVDSRDNGLAVQHLWAVCAKCNMHGARSGTASYNFSSLPSYLDCV